MGLIAISKLVILEQLVIKLVSPVPAALLDVTRILRMQLHVLLVMVDIQHLVWDRLDVGDVLVASLAPQALLVSLVLLVNILVLALVLARNAASPKIKCLLKDNQHAVLVQLEQEQLTELLATRSNALLGIPCPIMVIVLLVRLAVPLIKAVLVDLALLVASRHKQDLLVSSLVPANLLTNPMPHLKPHVPQDNTPTLLEVRHVGHVRKIFTKT